MAKGRCEHPSCHKWSQKKGLCREHERAKAGNDFEEVACYVKACSKTLVRLKTNRAVRHCRVCRQYLANGLDPAVRLEAGMWRNFR